MASFTRLAQALLLGVCLHVGATLAQAAPRVDSFFNLRLGKVTIPGQRLVDDKAPVSLPKGAALGFYYQDAEIINVARVLTLKGELMLETRSLDPIIWLSTENLMKGTYRLEILSGEQKAEGTLVIK